MAQKPRQPEVIDWWKIPGVKHHQGTVRRNLYHIGRTEKEWAEKNKDSLTIRKMSAEELEAYKQQT